MSDDELGQVIAKTRKLRELRRARERVKQLERQLRGEPAKPEESTYVPEFLRLSAADRFRPAARARLSRPDVRFARAIGRPGGRPFDGQPPIVARTALQTLSKG